MGRVTSTVADQLWPECLDTGLGGRTSATPRRTEVSSRRGKKNPPLDLTPAADGAPVTFDTMATAYLRRTISWQRYRSLTTARARVEHLRSFFGGALAEAITADRMRDYQLRRRTQSFEAATINRETSALSRMVPVGDPARPARTDAVLSQAARGESAARRILRTR